MGSVERIPIRSAPLDRLSHRDAAIEALRFEQGRQRFIACRSAVPRILGRYLGSRPPDVRSRYGPYAKPRLTDPIELPEAGGIDTSIGVGHG